MRKIILYSIFAICIIFLNSCDKIIGGRGGGYSGKIASTQPIMESLANVGGTPPGYGVLMVYFEELCISENERVSIYVGSMYIGDILEATGRRDPQYGEQNASCITYPLEIGSYSMSLKIGGDSYPVNSFEIKQNFCTRVPFTLPCQ